MFALLLASLCFQLAFGTPPSFDHSQVILPSYTLHWTVNKALAEPEVMIGIQTTTTGWVGFGIAEPTSGSMGGSDMVTVYLNDNGGHTINDRYALGMVEPLIDTCQDWVYLGGERTNGGTFVWLKRKWNTTDTQDRPFVDGMMKIVVAHGDNGQDFSYHFKKTAAGVVFSGQAIGITTLPFPTKTFRRTPYPLTSATTEYNLFTFNNLTAVDFPTNVDIVAIDVVIANLTRQYVHHLVVYGCPNATYNNNFGSMLWAWAPGIEGMILPDVAGFRFGPGGYQSMEIQYHYTNFDGSGTGLLETSGLIMHYSTTLRTYEAGVFELGDYDVSNPITFPPSSTKSFTTQCIPYCTNNMPWDLHVFSSFLHMHEIGQQMWTTQWRGGAKISEQRIEFWDFNYQQNTPINLTVKAGDTFFTTCQFYNYKSQTQSMGLASNQEMCVHLMGYYPKVPGTARPTCGYKYTSGRNYSSCGGNFPPGLPYNPIDDELTFGYNGYPRQFSRTPATCLPPAALVTTGVSQSTGVALSVAVLLCFLVFTFM